MWLNLVWKLMLSPLIYVHENEQLFHFVLRWRFLSFPFDIQQLNVYRLDSQLPPQLLLGLFSSTIHRLLHQHIDLPTINPSSFHSREINNQILTWSCVFRSQRRTLSHAGTKTRRALPDEMRAIFEAFPLPMIPKTFSGACRSYCFVKTISFSLSSLILRMRIRIRNTVRDLRFLIGWEWVKCIY